MSRRRTATKARRVTSGGPDAVHLCLTVGKLPHLWGCAWASYGEARLPGPVTAGSLRAENRLLRARRLGREPVSSDETASEDGRRRKRE